MKTRLFVDHKECELLGIMILSTEENVVPAKPMTVGAIVGLKKYLPIIPT
jgi:hypothetical protein